MDHKLDIEIRISGLNKVIADQLLDNTPIQRQERYSRGFWQYSTLMVKFVRVGILQSYAVNRPLHISLDLTTLKEVDEDWQTTLETLGVL